MKLQFASLILLLSCSLNSFAQGTESSVYFYKMEKSHWLALVLRTLEIKPIWEENTGLQEVLNANPKLLNSKGNLIFSNALIKIPLRRIPNKNYIHVDKDNLITIDWKYIKNHPQLYRKLSAGLRPKANDAPQNQVSLEDSELPSSPQGINAAAEEENKQRQEISNIAEKNSHSSKWTLGINTRTEQYSIIDKTSSATATIYSTPGFGLYLRKNWEAFSRFQVWLELLFYDQKYTDSVNYTFQANPSSHYGAQIGGVYEISQKLGVLFHFSYEPVTFFKLKSSQEFEGLSARLPQFSLGFQYQIYFFHSVRPIHFQANYSYINSTTSNNITLNAGHEYSAKIKWPMLYKSLTLSPYLLGSFGEQNNNLMQQSYEKYQYGLELTWK